MRARGLDSLVDAYGVHNYPSMAEGAAARYARLNDTVMAECRGSGQPGGKPCWITEWGRAVKEKTCPVDDSGRFRLVQEMRTYYTQFAKQGRLQGLFFYTWQGYIHADHEEPKSAFLCGSLTESGKLALAPLF